ncbi:hypothetical protein FMUND_9421 [Fusarium mundagurra]|uniref:Uncharacterized protein n=1 Tax=Fusarium mundagurra TaxID=1567541 RepID=A0A8H5YFZ9_9HYPO|nr:hypothetical protein FMUND_9421 [Fusarium mundagurra]
MDKQYLVYSKTEYSGGPICVKKFDSNLAIGECSGIEWKPSPKVKVEDNCHIDKDAKTSIRPLALQGLAPSMIKREASPMDMPPGCDYRSDTTMVGYARNWAIAAVAAPVMGGVFRSRTIGVPGVWDGLPSFKLQAENQWLDCSHFRSVLGRLSYRIVADPPAPGARTGIMASHQKKLSGI